MRALWLLWLRVFSAIAVPTNYTIDDASGLVKYLGSEMYCVGCTSATFSDLEVDQSKVNQGTMSIWATSGGAMEFNFTGFALHVFIILSPVVTEPQLNFSLDGVHVGTKNQEASPVTAAYNVSAYTNTSIPDGAHTFRMDVGSALTTSPACVFDYAIYTSDLLDNTSSSSAGQTGSITLSSSSHTPSITSSSAKKKPPVGAIVGAVAGAVALIFQAFELSKEPVGAPPVMAQARPLSPEQAQSAAASPTAVDPSQPIHLTSPATQEDGGLAEKVRLLTEQLQQLREQVQGGSTVAAPETAALERSLSLMKREQTQALQQHRLGSRVTDALVHTDSGLRLTAGRAVDELPPTYVAD
ncbi:hypothetical protein DFH06DRAFT_1471485 [Mycena polygramma]|nr:hypothetical protein DFH06DRAFT_1471485 [Mycena polygramma]